MKSFCLILFFILIIFVITTKANTKNQIVKKYAIESGGYKAWLKEVSGYDKLDHANGYAGVYGEPITSLRMDGGQKYRVHLLNRRKWLGKVNGNDDYEYINGYAGTVNGEPIDAVVIGGNVEYAAHVLGGGWLPPVSGYNLSDSINGYAGNIGHAIDAIMIKGRTYATSFFYIDSTTTTSTANTTISKDVECISQKGTCMNPVDCVDGIVLNKLCSGDDNNKCCIPNIYLNNSNTSNAFDALSITVIIIFSLIILVIILYYCCKYYKKWIKENVSFTIENHPSLVKDDKNSQSNYYDIVDAQVVEDEQNLIINPSTSLKS